MQFFKGEGHNVTQNQKAYKTVHELISTYLKDTDELRPELWEKEPGVREQLVRISNAMASVASVQHDLPDGHKFDPPGALAFGGSPEPAANGEHRDEQLEVRHG